MKNICLNWTVSILTGLFCCFLLSVLGFIFHLSINSVYLILSVILAVGLLIYFSKKDSCSTKSIIAQLVILLDFVLIAGVLCYFVPDFSYDGSTYHQAIIILLKWGLNPIYDSVVDFSLTQKYVFTSSIDYVQHFLKFFEVIGANIYTTFGKIELTKITNYMFMLVAFCYSFYSLKNFKLSNLITTIFSIIFVYNPVCVCQMLSNYVDGVFYYSFLILLFSLINYTKGIDKPYSLAIILMSGVIFSNIKLTGLFTSIVMFGLFLLIYKSKDLFKISVIALVLVLISGINPYFTNIQDGKNPFYPIIQNSVLNANKEFMITSYPPNFENMNRIQKLLFSTFAVSKNVSPLLNSQEVPALKLPFTLSGDDKFIYEDMRLAGFGYFFSGILLCAIILSCFLRFENKEDKKLFFVIMSILVLSILGNHEAWWARFVPQMWSLPIFIFLFLHKNNQALNKKMVITSLLMAICILNSLIINVQYFEYVLGQTKSYKEEIKTYPKILYISNSQLQQMPKLETLPVKLQEYGVEVIYIQE